MGLPSSQLWMQQRRQQVMRIASDHKKAAWQCVRVVWQVLMDCYACAHMDFVAACNQAAAALPCVCVYVCVGGYGICMGLHGVAWAKHACMGIEQARNR